MRTVFEKIHEFDGMPHYSKHEQLVQGIINAIEEKIIVQGNALPSVNAMIAETGFARETIMKGYRELLSRGIIEVKKGLGYFVAHNNVKQELKVALLMYAMDTFQGQLYSSFRKELGDTIHVDVFFHHGNIEVFETIISMIKNKYGMYVVSPIPHPQTKELLSQIPRNKFLMIDRYEPLDGDFNYVVQEFGKASYKAFAELAPQVKKFQEMIFFHEPGSLVPIEIIQSYSRFIKDYNINGKMLPAYQPGSLRKGVVYYTNDNAELWNILKDSISENFELGKDIGILSHNDELVKEIICGGITTYSTDFGMMGKKAAQAVLCKKAVHEIIPTTLIKRKSI